MCSISPDFSSASGQDFSYTSIVCI